MNQTLASSISIVLNIHREGDLLPITLASLDAAVADVQARGVHVEIIAVLDNADEITRRAMTQYPLRRYDAHKVIEVSNGSLGLSRNDGIALARGDYIFLADADDLISTNYFSATLIEAAESSEKTIFFPEFLFAFGDNYHITHYSDLDRVGILAFLKHHPYISRVCAHRSLFDQVKFSDSRLSQGHAYEDWHFNCEAVAAGYDVKTVKGTILFYRQRAGSLLRSADALSSRQIAPSKLFEPARFIQLHREWEARHGRVAVSDMSASELRDDTLKRSDIQAEFELAGRLEPEITLAKFKGVPFWFNHQNGTAAGQVYLDAATIIDGCNFSDVFFFPFLSKGGAEKYVLQVIRAIVQLNPRAEILLICGENYNGVSAEGDLPVNVTVLNLPVLDPYLSMDDRCLVALKAIERLAPTARLHFLSSVFGVTLVQRYSQLLKPYRCFFYRFNNVEKVKDGRLVVTYSPLDFIKTYIDIFEGIICDSTVMRDRDLAVVPQYAHKWHVLHAHVPLISRGSRNTGTHATVRVLWASRFDEQKRPELLPLIAAELRNRSLDIQIDAFGFSVFTEASQPDQSLEPELTYRGPFHGFFNLPLESYDVFLYTSWNDGVPNVILEAGAAGLPIIAPDVGGISEVIVNGETGILLSSLENDQDMATSYVNALQQMVEEPALAPRLTAGLTSLLQATYGQNSHEEGVQRIFGLNRTTNDAGTLSQYYLVRGSALRRQYVLEKSFLAKQREPHFVSAAGEYSRAHALAERYIRFAQGDSLGAKILAFAKQLVRPIWRRLRR
ncbi:glycosyltransferase [Bordetella sp. 15P40C-2]|uniref:glycosyltransferase n=1 Tax=Bordetella sp. 15P40C-2 TaxID=2572246 RepID=UPI0013214FA0|nr:glycosyltransferase [Bordetella sp. 15P40C-2]MVW71371.1 glycosyltransferase [Bordetella sp. 15P40C-2]